MATRALRLLLVDDNSVDRELMRGYLQRAGLECEICEAATLAEARERVQSFRPACILLDMSLPDGLAVEILEELASVHFPLGVIVVTGEAHERDAVKAIREGAQDYLDKRHLDPERLATTVRNAVQRAELAHERGRALAALEQADERKTELMGMLGHELRNPLNAISAALELVDGEDDGSRRAALEVIRRQTRHLGRLVEDLLEASRMSQGRIVLRRGPVLLAEVVRSAAQVVQPSMERRGHSFSVSVGSEPLEVYGDPVRIEQMLVNLLGNAAKYTEPGGNIELELEGSGDVAHISVRDDGIGMDPETMESVFEPFVQAERSLARSEGGLGLGLALVRKLAALHGGSVEAHSPGLGRGSTFRISLPLRWQQPAIARSGVIGVQTTPAPTGKRVLLVEDHADAAELLCLLLRHWGFDVSVAEDGERALELAESLRPDAILLDIGLPKLSGYEVARRIRSMTHFDSVLLLAITGYGAPEDRKRSQEAGIDGHLVKPVDPAELRGLLTPVSGRRPSAG